MILLAEPGWLDTTRLLSVSKQIIIYLDNPILIPVFSGMAIYLQVEPEAIIKAQEYLLKNYKLYDYILTFNDIVLNGCPNAVKYIYGTTWISPLVWSSINIERKQFEISTVIGNKFTTPGHLFRKAVYTAQDSLPKGIPYRFFKSIHNPPHLFSRTNDCYFKDPSPEGKSELFLDSQFHLVIENSRQTNYFTEKLCDCLLTKTIPIYYGCPNISEYFNTDGWIILESDSISELSEKLLVLTPEYYSKHTSIIQQNFFRAMHYMDVYANINKALINLNL